MESSPDIISDVCDMLNVGYPLFCVDNLIVHDDTVDGPSPGMDIEQSEDGTQTLKEMDAEADSEPDPTDTEVEEPRVETATRSLLGSWESRRETSIWFNPHYL